MKNSLYFICFMLFCSSCKNSGNTENTNAGADSTNTTKNASSGKGKQFVSDSLIVSRVGIDNSPYNSIQRMVGLDLVTIKYNSINFYENMTAGDVIKKYGKIWMISDYHPMLLNSTSDFYVCNSGVHEGVSHHLKNLANTNDHSLIKAHDWYALYLEPNENGEWTLYFNSRVNSDTGSRLLYNYDPSKNIASVKIQPENNDKFEDQLFVKFYKTGRDSSLVSICFGKIKLSFKINYNNSERLFSRDTSYLASVKRSGHPVDWSEYLEAAEDCSNTGVHLDSALVWITEAIKQHTEVEKQDTKNDIHIVTLLETKSGVLAGMNKYKEAVECLDSAIKELSTESKPNHDAISQVQKQVNNLKKYTKN